MIVGYGAVAYVAFLGVFVYTIGFVANAGVPKVIDDGTSGPVTLAVLVNAGLLTLFAAQHSIMARPWFKRWWTRFVPVSIERSTFVLAASLVLALLLWQWRPLPTQVWSVEGTWPRATLWGLYGFGWLMVVGSTFLIDHFDLFGLRQVVARARGRSHQPPGFRQPLLYRLVRHPIMVGFVEERDLLAAHGEAYQRYVAQVPRFVPQPAQLRPRRDDGAARRHGAQEVRR
jgi:protein-S-isoprenylcysteine O-methyltransferase Ste14